MHDSPDAPNVDVFVDGNLLFDNVAYSTTTNYQALLSGQHRVQDQYFGSADYVTIPAGTYTFDATPAGSAEDLCFTNERCFAAAQHDKSGIFLLWVALSSNLYLRALGALRRNQMLFESDLV